METKPQSVTQTAINTEEKTQKKERKAAADVKKQTTSPLIEKGRGKGSTFKWIIAVAAFIALFFWAGVSTQGFGISTILFFEAPIIIVMLQYIICNIFTLKTREYRRNILVAAAIAAVIGAIAGIAAMGIHIYAIITMVMCVAEIVLPVDVLHTVFTRERKPLYWVTFAQIIAAIAAGMIIAANTALGHTNVVLIIPAVFMVIALQHMFYAKDKSHSADFERLAVTQAVSVFIASSFGLRFWCSLIAALLIVIQYVCYRLCTGKPDKLRLLHILQIVLCFAEAAGLIIVAVIDLIVKINPN